ncbi:putative dehydrogenase [Rubidibacter lacunae KORDI 51-2]|uniref:Putative dehydrogenase n=1 Tax=Rubidibacter lacunae KORDI 51-2 TaxID=582515 RepID=U5DK27_9CHRO|nr:Gfo/Idh/MocA family oxidoreductase [Rubidibacter lacunae]ERN41262.1 putative dehydrogenase [Rubidibacter lacunae KORDI 51-2]
MVAETDTVGVAVVGTGFGQSIHIPGFQAHPRARVVAVHNRDRAKACQIAEAFNIPHASDRLDAMLALPEVEAVSISTPPFLHYDMAKAVLDAGKHLLLEKPLALNVDDAIELYRLARDRGLVAAVDFEFRCVPSWQLLAEYLSAGYVGNIRLVTIDWLVASRANPERAWNWYAQKDKGGGALGAIGSHSFDYLLWLFGGVRKLCARLVTSIPTRPDPQDGGASKPVDADDTAILMLELADGAPCQLALSSATYAGRGHWIEVYGDRGTLALGSSNPKDYVHGFHLYAAPAGGVLAEVDVPERLAFDRVYPDGRLAPFIRIADRWLDAIQQGTTMVPSLREGVFSQLLMDATHQSSQSNAWVDIPELDRLLLP